MREPAVGRSAKWWPRLIASSSDRLDAGEIDVFESDELIRHYTRSAKELWKFCGYGGNRVGWAVPSLGTSEIRGRNQIGGAAADDEATLIDSNTVKRDRIP